MNTRLLITLLCTGAIAFACGPRSHTEASTTTSASVKKRSRHNGELAPTLLVHPAHDGVEFALDVANRGEKRMELNFASGQAYDFIVLDSVGRRLWQWSDGRMFTQAYQNKVIDGGDTLHLREQWQAKLAPGRYTVVATLLSSDHPMEQRLAFDVQ
jgi:hypothetical protein